MNDFLTIAIPVYNRTTYFKQALESALNQTHAVPVVVVDNASTLSDFEGILSGYRNSHLSYCRNETNLGMVGNWNRCISICKTPYLLILHDDDCLDLRYSEAFHKNWSAGVGIFIGESRFIDGEGRVLEGDFMGDMNLYRNIEHWCMNNPAPVGAIFSVECGKQLGGFNARLHYTPDFDFWFRLALTYSWRQIPALAGWYRHYGTAEQATTAFQRSGRVYGYRRIQRKRNRSLIQKHTAKRLPLPTGPGGFIHFSALIGMAGYLSRRWFRYATAICIRTPPQSLSGIILRPLLRLFGPSLPRFLAYFRKMQLNRTGVSKLARVEK